MNFQSNMKFMIIILLILSIVQGKVDFHQIQYAFKLKACVRLLDHFYYKEETYKLIERKVFTPLRNEFRVEFSFENDKDLVGKSLLMFSCLRSMTVNESLYKGNPFYEIKPNDLTFFRLNDLYTEYSKFNKEERDKLFDEIGNLRKNMIKYTKDLSRVEATNNSFCIEF